jgi:hypothetical protein
MGYLEALSTQPMEIRGAAWPAAWEVVNARRAASARRASFHLGHWRQLQLDLRRAEILGAAEGFDNLKNCHARDH